MEFNPCMAGNFLKITPQKDYVKKTRQNVRLLLLLLF